jgi:hypothetical protein
MFLLVDADDVTREVSEYIAAFAACGRGERDTQSLLAHYGVPLLLSTDDVFSALTGDQEVVAWAQQQVDRMRATDFDHIEMRDSKVTVLNATSALYRGSFSRHGRDGHELSRLTATYLVTDGPEGRRISALAIHGP